MKKILIVLLIASILLVGCTQEENQTANDDQMIGIEEPQLPEDEKFTEGTFDFSIQQCYGDKLKITNTGTGTIFMDSTIHLHSKEGHSDYGALNENTTIPPGETRIINLPKNVHSLNDDTFSLYKSIKTETGGTYHYRKQFKC